MCMVKGICGRQHQNANDTNIEGQHDAGHWKIADEENERLQGCDHVDEHKVARLHEW